MKDDCSIDDILGSMWSGGTLNFGGSRNAKSGSEDTEKAPAEAPKEKPAEAEKAVPQQTAEGMREAVSNAESARQALSSVSMFGATSSINASLEQLTKDVQGELDGLSERLKSDGLYSEPKAAAAQAVAESNEPAVDIDAAIKEAAVQAGERVIGQGEFISALAVSFKRPYVMKPQENMPAERAIILGAQGTGKHTALESFAEKLSEAGALKSAKIIYIDMAKYVDTESGRLFIQDIFAASKQDAQLVVFENFEKAHNTVVAMLGELFVDGKLPLSSRYVEQKGMLVETGTALVPNAVSEIFLAGRYLYLLTEQSEKKIMDTFGMPFIKAADDVCKTAALSEENVKLIAGGLVAAFTERAKKELGYDIKSDESAANALAEKYIPDEGVDSLQDEMNALMRALSEHKLTSHNEVQTAELKAVDGALTVSFDGELVQAKVSTDEEANAIVEVKKELDEIVGLDFIKKYILSLEDNLKVQQLRQKQGMKANFPSMHMIFTGNPGTGKTTIARIVSRYLKAIGLLSGGQLIEVTRADLVGRYVGHTAPLTQKAIDSALGGVLFIDEAYSLYRGNDDSFGLEAIDTLVKGMEDNRENLVVILAGYTKEMEEFLTSNSGLKSRFPNIVEFPDYTGKELLEISKSIAHSKGYSIREDCDAPLEVYFDTQQKTGDPRTNGNGRMARNKVEEAVLKSSKRNLNAGDGANLDELIPEDFDLKPVTEESLKPKA